MLPLHICPEYAGITLRALLAGRHRKAGLNPHWLTGHELVDEV